MLVSDRGGSNVGPWNNIRDELYTFQPHWSQVKDVAQSFGKYFVLGLFERYWETNLALSIIVTRESVGYAYCNHIAGHGKFLGIGFDLTSSGASIEKLGLNVVKGFAAIKLAKTAATLLSS
jgi:hypothetical protein